MKLDGRATSTLSATQQARATALGIGASLPNATGRVLKQTSGSLLGTGGNNTATLDQTNLPNINLSGSTSTGGAHQHTYTIAYSNGGASSSTFLLLGPYRTDYGINTLSTASSGNHSHTVTVPLGGSGTALPVEDAYLGVNQFVYLGQ